MCYLYKALISHYCKWYHSKNRSSWCVTWHATSEKQARAIGSQSLGPGLLHKFQSSGRCLIRTTHCCRGHVCVATCRDRTVLSRPSSQNSRSSGNVSPVQFQNRSCTTNTQETRDHVGRTLVVSRILYHSKSRNTSCVQTKSPRSSSC